MCALFTCCYVRFRCDSDYVCHVFMAVVVALCSLKASVLNSRKAKGPKFAIFRSRTMAAKEVEDKSNYEVHIMKTLA